jgi:hypothetical protein
MALNFVLYQDRYIVIVMMALTSCGAIVVFLMHLCAVGKYGHHLGFLHLLQSTHPASDGMQYL